MTSQNSKKEKQLLALNQSIAHRTTELKTLEASLKKLRVDTEEGLESLKSELIKAIDKDLTSSKTELKNLKISIEQTKKLYKKQESNFKEAANKLNSRNEELLQHKLVLEEENGTLVKENRTIKAEIEVNSKAKAKLLSEKYALDNLIFDLSSKKLELESTLSSLKERSESINKENKDLLSAYEAQISDKKAIVARLDAQLTAISQKIIDEEDGRNQEVEAMARRHIELEERDKNLRMREAKVEQQQSLIIRNHNLLKL